MSNLKYTNPQGPISWKVSDLAQYQAEPLAQILAYGLSSKLTQLRQVSAKSLNYKLDKSILCMHAVWLQMYPCLNRNLQEAWAHAFSLLVLQVLIIYLQGLHLAYHTCTYALHVHTVCSWIYFFFFAIKPLLHPIVRARTSWLQRKIGWFARDTTADASRTELWVVKWRGVTKIIRTSTVSLKVLLFHGLKVYMLWHKFALFFGRFPCAILWQNF